MEKKYQQLQKEREEMWERLGMNWKVTQGIIVNDLKINIYEMKKEYEVHVMFKNKDNIEKRMDGTIDYLAEEGYFDKKKKVKVIGMAFKGK